MKMIQRLGVLVPFLSVAVLAHCAWGQSGTYADPGNLLGPPGGLSIPNDAMSPGGGALTPTPADGSSGAESIGLGDVLAPTPFGDNSGYCHESIAPLESTGTWLQRGYWFVEEEAVILHRSWNKLDQPVKLATEFGARRLSIHPGRPGAFANMRMTVGRFMFRDAENRDHFTEFTYYGGGQSQLRGMARSRTPNNLSTPTNITSFFFAFDNSNEQSFRYTHEFGGLQYNYHVKSRMERDQMVLLPEGRWVRRAAPTRTRELLAGIRWFALDEWLEWDATGDPIGNSQTGSMRISTDNNLLGFQVGLGQAHEFARFSIGFRGKAGVYVNFTDITRSFVVRGFTAATGETTDIEADSVVFEEETLAFVGETSLIAKYHIHQNFSLRFSGELMYVDSIAVAPQQITFSTIRKSGNVSGSSLYLGFAFGIEGYW